MLAAMRAIDNQVAREMQRSPAQRDTQGVSKWEPYQKRVESVSAFVVNALGDQAAEIDGLLVLTQAFAKAFQIIAEDLGVPGLGSVRTEYSIECARLLEDVSRKVLVELRADMDPV